MFGKKTISKGTHIMCLLIKIKVKFKLPHFPFFHAKEDLFLSFTRNKTQTFHSFYKFLLEFKYYLN